MRLEVQEVREVQKVVDDMLAISRYRVVMKNYVATNIRFDEDDFALHKGIASKQGQSLAGLVRKVMKQSLDDFAEAQVGDKPSIWNICKHARDYEVTSGSTSVDQDLVSEGIHGKRK